MRHISLNLVVDRQQSMLMMKKDCFDHSQSLNTHQSTGVVQDTDTGYTAADDRHPPGSSVIWYRTIIGLGYKTE